MLARLVIALFAFAPFASGADPTIRTQRIDIHVDGERPIAGERSRFTVAPNGDIYFTYTLAAGEFECKPLGIIRENGGEIELTAIDSESTWNVDGWGTFGFPFDLAVDYAGFLHIAARHRGQPYGIDYWIQGKNGARLKSMGADVTFGGNNVALALLRGPVPSTVMVCLDRNRTQLTVWKPSDTPPELESTRPPELSGVAPGHFDVAAAGAGMGDVGTFHVVFCPMKGGPVCATYSLRENWTVQKIAPAGTIGVARSITSTSDSDGRLHVAFVPGESEDKLRQVNYATWSPKNRDWRVRTVATVSDDDRHAGRTDLGIAADTGRVVIAWEKGVGGKSVTKDYGGTVGAVMLTVIDVDQEPVTHELVPEHGGRPSLALSPDGNTAWVGVYTGNDDGDDFYLLRCRLDGREIAAAPKVRGDPVSLFRDGCLKDIDSGNRKAELRGLQRIDLSSLDSKTRIELIERYREHKNPKIRKSIVKGLAASADAREHFAASLAEVLEDPDRLVRKTFLEELGAAGDQSAAQPVVEKALASSDAMTRLSVAEVVRQHPDWIEFDAKTLALTKLGNDLDSEDLTAAGSAAMALERLIDVEGVGIHLKLLSQEGSPSQRVRAALIRFRSGDKEIDLSALDIVPEQGNEQAQLALCGLLGQMRTAACVHLLERSLQSPHLTVRTAAVFALRSCAHVAELKPIAKHPKGFDIVALRPTEPKTPEEKQTRDAAVAALIEALEHDDPNVREKAVDALSRVGAKEASQPILTLSDDPDAGVRYASDVARGIMSGESQALIDLESWKAAAPKRPARTLNPVYRQPTEIIDGVVQAGNYKQLLIDDFVIAESSGLVRRLHPFEKHPRNPVFQAQVPWEEGWADPFMSTVLYDPVERCFKMWYRCGPRHSLKAYAVSEDGIHWQRPDIAESAWQGFDHHNLLGFEGQIATWKKPGNNVQFFPDADGTDRYLSLFYRPPTQDYAISRSADGVRWTAPESARAAHGDVVSLTWDPARRHYLLFPKYKREHDGFVRRSFAATAVEKIDAPFTPAFPFLVGHRDDALVADGASRAYGSLLPDTLRLADFHSEIYSVTAIPYEGVAVALYDLWPVIGSAEGPLDMPVKISRDLKNWTDLDYPNRALSIGRFGEWDSGMVYGGNTLLVVDDEIRLYYLGANMGHCTRILPTTKPYHALGVGLATLRLDGFASLGTGEGKDGKPAVGEFTTKPLRVGINGNTSHLQINGRCHEGGSIRVALLDGKTGKPLPGFTLDDCDPFDGDSVRHPVTWKSGASLAELPESVRLQVVQSNAELFAFRFWGLSGMRKR